MAYVHRDTDNKIVKTTARPNGSEEQLSNDDPEVIEFLNPSELSVEEVYDKAIQNNKVIMALVLSLNDGSFVPGAGLTGSDLKQVILAKM